MGEGYHSVVLSDRSYHAPYFKFVGEVWKFKYQVLYQQIIDIDWNREDAVGFPRGWMAQRFLSYDITKWLNFQIFESTMWQNEGRGFDFQYATPILLTRPVEFSIVSPDNALLGVGGHLGPFKGVKIYGQLFLDEFNIAGLTSDSGYWSNKYAIQFGADYRRHTSNSSFYLRSEVNFVRPYTYSHRSNVRNYGHYNEPLAHPLGSNFINFVQQVNYRYDRWKLSFLGEFNLKGEDKDNVISYGGDIFKNYDNSTGDYGVQTWELVYHFWRLYLSQQHNSRKC